MKRETNWPLLALTRFALSLIVLSFHYDRVTTSPLATAGHIFNGGVAVEAFFIISGYSIAHSIGKRPAGYLQRRGHRILPCYWVCYALSMLPWAVYASTIIRFRNGEIVECPTPREFLCGAFLLQGVLCPLIQTMGTAWSLVIEEWLYVQALWIDRIPPRACAIMIAASCVYYWFGPAHAAPFGVFAFAWAWLLGFQLYKNRDSVWVRIAAFAVPPVLAAHVCDQSQVLSSTALLVPVAFLCFGDEIEIPAPAAKVCSWLGDLSYELYLFGWSTMMWLWAFYPRAPFILYPASAVAVSIAVLHLVDRPLRLPRTRDNSSSQVITTSLICNAEQPAPS